MIECKVCLMNSSINEFYTNNDGICNFCTDWDLKKSSYRDFSEKQEKQNLHNLKNEIIKSNPKGKYDCIIGLSGGTDSSYVTYLAWKMGLNALVIHMDNGWNSKISNLNIDRLLDKTGFDYKTLILNWNEFKDLQKSFLKAPKFPFQNEPIRSMLKTSLLCNAHYFYRNVFVLFLVTNSSLSPFFRPRYLIEHLSSFFRIALRKICRIRGSKSSSSSTNKT